MSEYEATIAWQRGTQKFVDNRYSRAHEWAFDGGARVPASSSPLSVPAPLSVAANVDPEEAVVAAASSCHMLWFLSIAAKHGFTVDQYTDRAFGVMGKNSDHKIALTRITLRPQTVFSGALQPTAEQLQELHHQAHEQCTIAHSLRADVVVEIA
ncbi:MAG: OsmC family peroxiredoxin [Glaciimonas sp.]|nr:OsmC family peroxiredoxin [Glaciimonas sp.]